MDPCLDRYISYEYLVSPRPEHGRPAPDDESKVMNEAKRAVEQARECVKEAHAQAPSTATALAAAEDALARASALLESLLRRDTWAA